MDKVCLICKAAPRRTFSTGSTGSYCIECHRKKDRDARARKRQTEVTGVCQRRLNKTVDGVIDFGSVPCPNPTYKGQAWCRSCSQSYQNTRKGWFALYKVMRGCVDCGYNKHAAALDFDHLPGSKKLFNVGNNSGIRRERLMAEIEKCEIVCANCHRIRTYERREAARRASDHA